MAAKKKTETAARPAAQDLRSMHCNKSGAEMVGKEIARMAKEKNINQVVFDRNGYIYHGRVKAVADGAREGGLEF